MVERLEISLETILKSLKRFLLSTSLLNRDKWVAVERRTVSYSRPRG